MIESSRNSNPLVAQRPSNYGYHHSSSLSGDHTNPFTSSPASGNGESTERSSTDGGAGKVVEHPSNGTTKRHRKQSGAYEHDWEAEKGSSMAASEGPKMDDCQSVWK